MSGAIRAASMIVPMPWSGKNWPKNKARSRAPASFGAWRGKQSSLSSNQNDAKLGAIELIYFDERVGMCAGVEDHTIRGMASSAFPPAQQPSKWIAWRQQLPITNNSVVDRNICIPKDRHSSPSGKWRDNKHIEVPKVANHDGIVLWHPIIAPDQTRVSSKLAQRQPEHARSAHPALIADALPNRHVDFGHHVSALTKGGDDQPISRSVQIVCSKIDNVHIST